jgi:hypothetical protein
LAAIEGKGVVKQPLDISLMPPRKQPTTKDDDEGRGRLGEKHPAGGLFSVICALESSSSKQSLGISLMPPRKQPSTIESKGIPLAGFVRFFCTLL